MLINIEKGNLNHLTIHSLDSINENTLPELSTKNNSEYINYYDEYAQITTECSESSSEIITKLNELLLRLKQDQSKDSMLFDLLMEVQNKVETLKCIQENEKAANSLIKESNYESDSKVGDSKGQEMSVANNGNSTYATYNRFTDEGKLSCN